MINAREWRAIAAHLPPTHGPGKPRSDDRLMVSAFFYAEACNCSLESLPAGYGNPRSLRTRRQRWQVDGTLQKLLQVGAPAIARMRRYYWGLVRDASLVDGPDWRSSSEFFGRGVIPRLPHAQPRGRYAARRRRVPAGR
jgi:transposase